MLTAWLGHRLKWNILPTIINFCNISCRKRMGGPFMNQRFLGAYAKCILPGLDATHSEFYVVVWQTVTIYQSSLRGYHHCHLIWCIVSYRPIIIKILEIVFNIHRYNIASRNVVYYGVLWMPIYVPTGICYEHNETPMVVLISWYWHYIDIILGKPVAVV